MPPNRSRFTHQVVQEALQPVSAGMAVHPAHDREPMSSAATRSRPRTDVFISPYMLHRHPQFWSDPEEFQPQRFAGVDAKERHRFAYIPFSVGPRHCIGENMAMFEMLVHVNRMSRRFRLKRADDRPIELEAQINLRPRSHLMMNVEVR